MFTAMVMITPSPENPSFNDLPVRQGRQANDVSECAGVAAWLTAPDDADHDRALALVVDAVTAAVADKRSEALSPHRRLR